MPKVAKVITSSYDSILRPVVIATARDVCQLLDLPNNITLIMPGPGEETPMTGSTIGYQGEPSRFDSEDQITIEATDEAMQERVLSTPVYQVENIPFFLDTALGIKMKPVYSPSEIVLQFTYRASNRTKARQFREEALLRVCDGRAENLHNLQYHYPIPIEYLQLLKHIHTLRETQAGYGDSFDKWMREHLTKRATNLTNVIGKEQLLVIAEHQIRPIGFFDFTTQPVAEDKEKETGPYVVKFEYHLMYDKVIGAVAEYPLVVHNQLLDDRWFGQRRASGDVLDPDNFAGVAGYSRYAMDHIVKLNRCCPKREGLSIPEFDQWQPTLTHPTTHTIANVMLQVDPADPYAILNLQNDLGDFKLADVLFPFLKGEASYLNRFAQSVIYLSLYQDDKPLADGSLLVDRDLNIQSNFPLDLRGRYHLRIAVVTDLNFINQGALERFRYSGQACLNILSALQGQILGEGFLPPLLGGQIVTLRDIKEIALNINNKRKRQSSGHYAMITVGTFLIVTQRRNDYARYRTQTDRTAGQRPDSDTGGRTPLPAADQPC